MSAKSAAYFPFPYFSNIGHSRKKKSISTLLVALIAFKIHQNNIRSHL